jgi:hypothetical protein
MFATLAKQERARISERTIAGLKVARAKGRIIQNNRQTAARPGQEFIGEDGVTYRYDDRVLYCTTSKAEALLFDAEFSESNPKPRTRIVQLRTPLPVGSQVSGKTDLQPVEPE